MSDATAISQPIPPGPHQADPSPPVTTITAGTAPADAAPSEVPPPSGRARYEPNRVEIAGGVVLLGLWAVVFGIGNVFPSEPYRNALAGNGTVISNANVPVYLAIFLMTYTVTNVAVLCCIAAWLGELGRRTRIDGASQEGEFLRGDYLAAVMRGFLGYLAILTGFVVVGSGVNLFVTPSAEGYVRLAAIVSLAGFLIGFNPAIFRRFEGTIIGKVTTETRTADGVVTQTVEGPAKVVGPATAPSSPPADHLLTPTLIPTDLASAKASANGPALKEAALPGP